MITTSNKVRVMENELRMWQTIQREALLLLRADPTDPTLEHYGEETDVLLMYTEWPLLKMLIQRNIERYRPGYLAAVAAATKCA